MNWGVSTTAAVWVWSTITAFTDTTHVTATLTPVENQDGTAGTTNLPRTTACKTWRLGLFSNTTGYPTCGTYHEGRLWLRWRDREPHGRLGLQRRLQLPADRR